MSLSITDFPTYNVEELKQIKILSKHPESMTLPYGADLVKIKPIRAKLENDNDVFVVSTQKKKPVHRFKDGQEIQVCAPFLFDSQAICLGKVEYMHKGFRMYGYFFQFI